MVGRKIIVKEWKSEDLPPAHVWFTQLGVVAALERLTFKINNQLEKYDSKWNVYLSHIAGPGVYGQALLP